MKKIIGIILIMSVLLTACTSGGNSGTESDSSTLGDAVGDGMDGDGVVGEENGLDGMMEGDSESNNQSDGESDSTNTNNAGTDGMMEGDSDSVNTNDTGTDGVMGNKGDSEGNSANANGTGDKRGNFESVKGVTSADDAVNFIGANVYSLCGDVIPLVTETRIIPREDMDGLSYHSSLTDTDGISDIIISESMVGAFPYSLVMLRTDKDSMGSIPDIMKNDALLQSMCVSAEAASAVTLDNDIVLVMGSAAQVDAVMNAVLKAGNGVYSEIGEIVKLLG